MKFFYEKWIFYTLYLEYKDAANFSADILACLILVHMLLCGFLLTAITFNKLLDDGQYDDDYIWFRFSDNYSDNELFKVFTMHYFDGVYFFVTVVTTTGFGDLHGVQAWHQRIYGGCYLVSQNIRISLSLNTFIPISSIQQLS